MLYLLVKIFQAIGIVSPMIGYNVFPIISISLLLGLIFFSSQGNPDVLEVVVGRVMKVVATEVEEPSYSSQKISFGGTITSQNDPIPGTGLEQSYYIFPVNNSSKVYSGVITFTSSKPVQLQSINILTLNNTLKLPVQFGTLYTFPLNNTIIIPIDLFDVPKVTGSALFSGNGLRFITNEPFLLTYSFSGEQFDSVEKNNIESGLETYRKLIGITS